MVNYFKKIHRKVVVCSCPIENFHYQAPPKKQFQHCHWQSGNSSYCTVHIWAAKPHTNANSITKQGESH